MFIEQYWTFGGGLFDVSTLSLLVISLLEAHVTILAVTIYLHRTVTHRGVELVPSLEHFFRGWLWAHTGMNTKEWVSIHKKHHQNVETINDPHTPAYYIDKSLFRLLVWIAWVGVRKYVTESRNKETLEKYGQNTPDDWIERNLYTPHNHLGIILLLIVMLVLYGLPGFIVWVIQVVWIPVFAAGVVNGAGHLPWIGYQNYKYDDKRPDEYLNVANSTNIFPIGILIGGEELHNNHHADASSPFFAHKPFEFDVGGLWIRFFCLMRIAKLRKPLQSTSPGKSLFYKLFNLGS